MKRELSTPNHAASSFKESVFRFSALPSGSLAIHVPPCSGRLNERRLALIVQRSLLYVCHSLLQSLGGQHFCSLAPGSSMRDSGPIVHKPQWSILHALMPSFPQSYYWINAKTIDLFYHKQTIPTNNWKMCKIAEHLLSKCSFPVYSALLPILYSLSFLSLSSPHTL